VDLGPHRYRPHGVISEQLESRLTVDGLRELIADLRLSGELPAAILVSEYDRREINQDLLAGSAIEVAKADQRPEHDGDCIAIIEGILVRSHPDVPRGKARLVYYDKATLH
jgi:hypothetical protein